MFFIVCFIQSTNLLLPCHIPDRREVSDCKFLQILKLLLQILKVKGGETYSPESCIHDVTVFPLCCLNTALKVL